MRPDLGPLPASWPHSYPLHRPVLTAVARAWDQGEHAGRLLEHAGLGVAALAAHLAPRREDVVVVVAGPGHNGADGYVAARCLVGWGRQVEVYAVGRTPFGQRVPPDVCEAARRAREEGVPLVECSDALAPLVQALAKCHLVVDALLGVGLERPLEGAFLEAVQRMNASDARRLSVDVPSGMDSDSGEPLPVCVQADVTAAMAAPKLGYGRGRPGAAAAGHVVEVDIGLPWHVHAPALRP